MTTADTRRTPSAPRPVTNPARGGFTLVELLVVIGIIAILIGILLPTLSKARQQGNAVKCLSNLRQVGQSLQIYSETWKGWVYPPRLGANQPPNKRWPVHVFKMKYPPEPATDAEARAQDPALWRPEVLVCPSDFEPVNKHSYVLNDHIGTESIKYSSRVAGRSPSDVIVLGEKLTDQPDYYMNLPRFGAVDASQIQESWRREFARVVDVRRHGISRGSNYLNLDWSVRPRNIDDAIRGIDPWSVQNPATQPVVP